MRGLIQILCVIALVIAGLQGLKSYKTGNTSKTSKTEQVIPNISGFVTTAMPEGTSKNVVMILAPANCPSDAAKRADSLAEKLTDMGVPNVRGNAFSLSIPDPTEEEKAAAQRAIDVVNGEIPAVFINGMGKANPSAEEVAAVYEKTK